jgi:hypothetical protein
MCTRLLLLLLLLLLLQVLSPFVEQILSVGEPTPVVDRRRDGSRTEAAVAALLEGQLPQVRMAPPLLPPGWQLLVCEGVGVGAERTTHPFLVRLRRMAGVLIDGAIHRSRWHQRTVHYLPAALACSGRQKGAGGGGPKPAPVASLIPIMRASPPLPLLLPLQGWSLVSQATITAVDGEPFRNRKMLKGECDLLLVDPDGVVQVGAHPRGRAQAPGHSMCMQPWPAARGRAGGRAGAIAAEHSRVVQAEAACACLGTGQDAGCGGGGVPLSVLLCALVSLSPACQSSTAPHPHAGPCGGQDGEGQPVPGAVRGCAQVRWGRGHWAGRCCVKAHVEQGRAPPCCARQGRGQAGRGGQHTACPRGTFPGAHVT